MLDRPQAEPLASGAFGIAHARDDELNGWALMRLAHDIAMHYRLPPLAVVESMARLPQCFLTLAGSPEGVTAIGSAVATDLGSEVASPFLVSLH